MSERTGIRWDTRLVFGVGVLILGVLLLLRNFDSELGRTVWNFWPLILVLLGLALIFQPMGRRQTLLGSAMVIIGLLLIFNNFEVIRLRAWDLWPIILILLGISIISRNFWGPGRQTAESDYFNLSLFLAGGKYRIDSKDFKGGKITTIMGGGEIDLHNAVLRQDEAVIDVMAVMGGVDIRVPTDWQVVMQGTPILGGMEDNTAPVPSGDQRPRIIIKGIAIMGGVDVKN